MGADMVGWHAEQQDLLPVDDRIWRVLDNTGHTIYACNNVMLQVALSMTKMRESLQPRRMWMGFWLVEPH